MHKISLAATLTLSLALAACGGGGDSGSAAPAPVAAALALTSTNYTVAAQESVSSTYYLLESGSMLTGAQVSTGDAALMRAVLAQVGQLGRWLTKAPRVAVGVTTTQTEACSGGGSLTSTVNDANGNEDADPGDSVSVSMSNCEVIPGFSASGVLAATFNAVTGTFGTAPYTATVSINLQNFAVVTAAGRSTGNGRMELALSTSASNQETVSVTVSGLSTESSYGNLNSTRTMSDFTVRAVTTPGGTGSSTSATVSGTLSSTGLGARSVTIATVTPFVKASTAQYPGSGQLIATGAANSKVRLTALSVSSVRLELDADGDGSYETSSTVAWSSLL